MEGIDWAKLIQWMDGWMDGASYFKQVGMCRSNQKRHDGITTLHIVLLAATVVVDVVVEVLAVLLDVVGLVVVVFFIGLTENTVRVCD